ncbi:MAG TPA: DsbE family thiol:disulfide interchange protein [Aestuariivirga sp.]|nr:DsbE family thiol:disulfide interchange protein [Aestuariivirga sp.]
MTPQPTRRRLGLALLPVVIFAGLALVFWKGLFGNPSELPSVLIGKPVPEFVLPAIEGSAIAGLTSADLKSGNVSIVNIWASWCGPCRLEHPILLKLSQRKDIRLYGINNKDKAENARRFLGTLGQPYAAIGADTDGRTTIDWGSYGVPETFIVDGKGIIRFKWIGPLSPEIMAGVFAAEIEKAKLPAVVD